jgi:hypothetical protein
MVYPGNGHVPSFNGVLQLADSQINKYLLSIGIETQVNNSVNVQSIDGNSKANPHPADKILWDENHYAWFFVNGIPGGTDVYYHRNSVLEFEIWEEEMQSNFNIQKMKETIRKNLTLGYHWRFRRSAGQPAIIALSYGMLAASVAKLTNGFIYSDDNAWDYSMFPATPDDFFEWYFNPEMTSDEDIKEFTKRCIVSLRDELNASKSARRSGP